MTLHFCKYIKWLLPVLFIMYYGNVSVFLHTHIENGEIVVHSHPFPKSCGEAPHHHNSLAEILFIHGLSTISAPDGAIHTLHINSFTRNVNEITDNPVYPAYLTSFSGIYFLRAPPVTG